MDIAKEVAKFARENPEFEVTFSIKLKDSLPSSSVAEQVPDTNEVAGSSPASATIERVAFGVDQEITKRERTYNKRGSAETKPTTECAYCGKPTTKGPYCCDRHRKAHEAPLLPDIATDEEGNKVELTTRRAKVVNCVVCGKEFETSWNKKTCSMTCANKRDNQLHELSYRKRKELGVKNFGEAQCIVCGDTFEKKRYDQVTCGSKCSRDRNTRKAKENYIEARKGIEEEYEGKTFETKTAQIELPPKRTRTTSGNCLVCGKDLALGNWGKNHCSNSHYMVTYNEKRKAELLPDERLEEEREAFRQRDSEMKECVGCGNLFNLGPSQNFHNKSCNSKFKRLISKGYTDIEARNEIARESWDIKAKEINQSLADKWARK